jgi:single-strand DNA-binding protein
MKGAQRGDIVGALSADAQMTYAASGTAVLKFKVPVDVKVRDGQAPRTNWYTCTLFGKRAEALAQYLIKGQLVHVRGDLDMEPWTDRDGKERHTLTLTNINELDLLGSKPQAVAPAGGQGEPDESLPF